MYSNNGEGFNGDRSHRSTSGVGERRGGSVVGAGVGDVGNAGAVPSETRYRSRSRSRSRSPAPRTGSFHASPTGTTTPVSNVATPPRSPALPSLPEASPASVGRGGDGQEGGSALVAPDGETAFLLSPRTSSAAGDKQGLSPPCAAVEESGLVQDEGGGDGRSATGSQRTASDEGRVIGASNGGSGGGGAISSPSFSSGIAALSSSSPTRGDNQAADAGGSGGGSALASDACDNTDASIATSTVTGNGINGGVDTGESRSGGGRHVGGGSRDDHLNAYVESSRNDPLIDGGAPGVPHGNSSSHAGSGGSGDGFGFGHGEGRGCFAGQAGNWSALACVNTQPERSMSVPSYAKD